jgi:O-antigen ligase
MSNPKRVLLFGGISLALLGMTYGLWYAVIAEHQALEGIGVSLTNAFAASAHGNRGVAAENLRQYRQAKYNYDRQVDAHSHWIGLSMVLIVLGLGFDYVTFSAKQKLALAWVLLLGSLLFPAGVLLQTVNHGMLPRAMAIAGSGLVVLGMTLAIAGVLRRPAADQSPEFG